MWKLFWANFPQEQSNPNIWVDTLNLANITLDLTTLENHIWFEQKE